MSLSRRALAAGLAAWAAAEISHWWASSRLPSSNGQGEGADVLVVLGYPTRNDGTLHPIQTWRCQIALRSIDRARATTLVFTGAGPEGRPSEAAAMASYAQSHRRGAAFDVVVDERARSTWENLGNNMDVLRSAGRIRIASDPLHASRAARYLREMAPELAPRLARADGYRPAEHPVLKMGAAAYEWLALVKSVAATRWHHGRRPLR